MATIYMTDDVHRPDDGNGNPIEQSSSELAITINGYSYDWYFSARCDFNTNKSDADSRNARVQCINRLFLNGSSTPSTLPTLRFVYRLSYNNNPETYFEEKIVNLLNWYTTVDIDIFSRANPNTSGLTRTYGTNRNLASSTSFYFTGANSEIQDMEYSVGCKIQGLVNGDWVDINRSGKNTPWKIFASYAPFYQSITPPTHFYANGINTFTASIGSKYKTNYTDILIKGRYQTTYSANRIVRNINPPYITKGQSTQYLYFCPCLPVSEPEFSKYKTYEFWIELSVTDPSDSNYEIIVARRKVSGSVEYLDEDDLSMYGTPTYSIADTSSMYEQYDVFLRNVTTQIVLSVNITASYGAPAYASYTTNQSSGYFQGDVESGFDSVVVPLSTSGTSEIIRIHVWGVADLLNEKITIPIIDYSVPSLPTASIHRCASDGTANDNGDHCRIDWAVAITSINNQNGKKLTIRHPEGTAEFNPLDSYTQSGSLIVAASTESTYGIDFTVSDDLNTITKSLRLSTAQAVMDLLYGGGGVAFGKVASVQNAVEISDLWKLICYKLSLDGIDMNAWVKQLESRVGALEQFAGNTGSTTQFQVSFFNDSELLKRDWVRTGNDAVAPSESPTKEPTDTNTYSFVGWALTNGKQTADANALTNITNHRNIYAAFSSAIRLYTVNFKNGDAVVKTEDDLQYLYSATAPSTNPSKSGYVFAGWCPSGRIVTKNTDAIAQFFDNTEIADSWEEIMESVNDGTVSKRYNQGQYKTLDCGSNGTVIMRIKGFNLDKIANSSKTAKVSWEAIECLAQTRRINPTYNAGEEGTGALGGWGKSELRQWLNGEFFNSIDPVVRNSIKSVSKVSYSRDVNGSGVINSMSLDKIFIPSAEEISGHYDQRGYIYETDGIDFRYMTSTFSNKRANGSASYIDYWLRTVGNVGWNSFRYYQDFTNKPYDTSEKLKGICIGFCT